VAPFFLFVHVDDPCMYERADVWCVMCVPVLCMWLFEFLVARLRCMPVISFFVFLPKKGLPGILLDRRVLWDCGMRGCVFNKLCHGLLGTYIRIFRCLLGEYAVDLNRSIFRKKILECLGIFLCSQHFCGMGFFLFFWHGSGCLRGH
jgi:hypothetical protein